MSRVQLRKNNSTADVHCQQLVPASLTERGCNHRSSPGQLGGLKAPKLPFSAGDPGGLSGLWNSGASSFDGPSAQQRYHLSNAQQGICSHLSEQHTEYH